MKSILLALALTTITCAQAQTPPRIVTTNCSGCHGLNGNATWPQIPKLAAQPAGYLEAQVKAFAAAPTVHVWDLPDWIRKPAPTPAGARNDPDARTFMIGLAKVVSADESREAAAWYSTRRATPGMAGDPELVAQGKKLFESGLPAQGVLGCGDCHGAQAQGLGDFPRLAGQHASYLARQLRAFSVGTRGHGSAMTAQARPLDSAQIEAVSAYLQGLP